MADFVPWLVTTGTEAGLEAVENVGDSDSDCDDEDNNGIDDVTGGEAADAVCLDVVWTASKPECCSLFASSGAELALLCWPAPPPSPSPFSKPPLPCL